jgi:hypothetical protein
MRDCRAASRVAQDADTPGSFCLALVTIGRLLQPLTWNHGCLASTVLTVRSRGAYCVLRTKWGSKTMMLESRTAFARCTRRILTVGFFLAFAIRNRVGRRTLRAIGSSQSTICRHHADRLPTADQAPARLMVSAEPRGTTRTSGEPRRQLTRLRGPIGANHSGDGQDENLAITSIQRRPSSNHSAAGNPLRFPEICDGGDACGSRRTAAVNLLR